MEQPYPFPPRQINEGFDILPLHELEIQQNKEIQKKYQILHCTYNWSSFQIKHNIIRKRHIPSLRDYHFIKHYMSYIDPRIKSNCGMKLKPGPCIDDISQCPIPGDMLDIYRTLK